MRLIDQGTSNERIIANCKVTGEYKGIPFESTTENYFWTHEENEPSAYWWREGNMACDCNRVQFLPESLREQHNGKCGGEIYIWEIIPLEGNLPILKVDGLDD